MGFEWDLNKARRNLNLHGFDFRDVLAIFFELSRVVEETTRTELGERRWRVIGELDDRMIAVISTERAGNIRIISARSASRDERARYRARTA